MKHCKWCKQEKPLSEFHKHLNMKDGYLNKCKVCSYEEQKEYRKTEKGKLVRAKEKQYPEAKKRYKQSEKGKLKATQYKRPKDREAAKNAVSYALRSGKLIRQPCEICGKKGEAHHWSYLPEHRLDVQWLCRHHHNQLHIEQSNLKSWSHREGL